VSSCARLKQPETFRNVSEISEALKERFPLSSLLPVRQVAAVAAVGVGSFWVYTEVHQNQHQNHQSIAFFQGHLCVEGQTSEELLDGFLNSPSATLPSSMFKTFQFGTHRGFQIRRQKLRSSNAPKRGFPLLYDHDTRVHLPSLSLFFEQF